ncbi:MAG TPA: hypothetical protein VLW54_11960 [Candidatus Acidoferrales bacterium]|nr:hypothetical protein [Candidatus Acidoferrales bacterium]
MSSAFILGVMFVAAVWAIGAWCIWEFGPGDRIRTVHCPVLKRRATILADVREARFPGSYAGLAICDVKLCSLLERTHLLCHKNCIHPGAEESPAR